VVFVFVVKALATAGTVFALGYPVRIAAVAGLALAQICETSFVLERVGAAAGMTPLGMGFVGQQMFISVLVLLMIATPFAVQFGPRIGELLESVRSSHLDSLPVERHPVVGTALENHVVVIGYGPAGRSLVTALRDASIPYVVVELNPQTVAELEASSEPYVYGDASRPHILEMAGLERAKMCAIVINDPAAAARVVELAHFMNPTLEIVVRARFLSDASDLAGAGASHVVTDEYEASIRLLTGVLRSYALPRAAIRRYREGVRVALLGTGGPVRIGPEKEASYEPSLERRAVTVHEGALAANTSIEELALRRAHGLTVLAVKRNGEMVRHPDASFRVQAGDRLIITGPAHAFRASAHLFRRQEGGARHRS